MYLRFTHLTTELGPRWGHSKKDLTAQELYTFGVASPPPPQEQYGGRMFRLQTFRPTCIKLINQVDVPVTTPISPPSIIIKQTNDNDDNNNFINVTTKPFTIWRQNTLSLKLIIIAESSERYYKSNRLYTGLITTFVS